MRTADDMEEFESYRDDEPPPRACPECGDDDRHEPDCSRNYKRAAERRIGTDNHYWVGYRSGKALVHWFPLSNEEPRLKLEVHLAGTTNTPRRAFALGELRGYREAQA